jgi:hypothetical protein
VDQHYKAFLSITHSTQLRRPYCNFGGCSSPFIHAWISDICRGSGKFGTEGRGHVTLLIRTILESEGNQDALIEPIVSAVASCMRPEWTGLGLKWIESFDKIPLRAILETMRSLDLFSETSLGHYLSIALRNKLFNILGPAAMPNPAKPVKAKARPKPPARRATDQPAERVAA